MSAVAATPKNGAVMQAAIRIEIPKLDIRQIHIKLIGDSELISHRWSEKAKKEILDKQMHEAQGPKEAKDPWRDYCESLYWLSSKPASPIQDDVDSATFGFPSVAFKAAAVGACRYVSGIKMTEARGAFHVNGEHVKLEGHPSMREDMVRVGMGVADIRYRGGFPEWSTVLTVSYNAGVFSPAQVVNLFNQAGFGVGVGEWRPEKDGPYGRFHVAQDSEQ